MTPAAPLPLAGSHSWRALAALNPQAVSEAARRVASTRLPPVNAAVVSPAGFVSETGPERARLRWQGAQVEVVDHRGVLAELGPQGLLDRSTVGRLRPYQAVEVEVAAVPGPLLVARLVAQLLVAGVPPLLDQVPVSVERLLGRQLAAEVRQLDRRVLSSAAARSAWSLRTRRQALRQLTMAGGPARVGVLLDWTDEVEGARLLEEARRQDWPDLVLVLLAGPGGSAAAERAAASIPGRAAVVVSGDLASALGAAVAEWPSDPAAPVLATVFGRGLTYGAHHVTDLVMARAYARSALVGVDVRRSYLQALDLGVESATEEGERFHRTLTPGAILASPQDLLRAERRQPGDGGARGYAVHDGGVTRLVASGAGPELEEALASARRQWRGWAEPGADQDVRPVPVPGRTGGRAYPSYFS